MIQALSHLTEEQMQMCLADSPSVPTLATTGAGVTMLIVFGAAILGLGAWLVIRQQRQTSQLATVVEQDHKLHSVATAVAVLATGAWSFTGMANAQVDFPEPGLPEYCYDDPTLTVDKNEAGDDQHDVEAGTHDITVDIINTSDEPLTDFTFNDTTETGQPAVFDQDDLDALADLTLQPGGMFSIIGTVDVAEEETHRNELTITATGEISTKVAESSDPTTLIGPEGPEPVPPTEPETPDEPEEPTINEVVATDPDVVRQCDIEPSVTTPEIVGVEYTAEREGDQLIITAAATEGYEFAEDQQTEWVIDMTYETSEWDAEAWDIEDPADWFSELKWNKDLQATVMDILPLTTKLDDIPWDADFNDHFNDWFAQVQEAGATVTIGEPTVEIEMRYDSGTGEYFLEYYDSNLGEWTTITHDQKYLEIDAGDVPAMQLQQTELGTSAVSEPVEFKWREQQNEPNFGQVNRKYTWPVTLTKQGDLCDQTKTIEMVGIAPFEIL